MWYNKGIKIQTKEGFNMGFVNKKTVTAGLPILMADWLRYKTEETGIPMGRLIQDAVWEKYKEEIEAYQNQQE